MKSLAYLFLITVTIILQSCSFKAVKTENKNTTTTGIPYFLPKGLITVNLVKRKEGKISPQYDLQVEPNVKYVADVDKNLTLTYKASAFADEHLCVARTPSGLLESVEFASRDRTADVTVKIAETVKALSLLGSETIPSLRDEGKSDLPFFGPIADDAGQIIFTATFDPFDPAGSAEVEKAISNLIRKDYSDDTEKSLGSSTNLVSIRLSHLSGKATTSGNGNFDKCNENSICFRTVIPASLAFNYGVEGETPGWIKSVELPDRSFVGVLDIERSSLIYKVTKIDLDKGVLTSFNVNTPSQAFAFAKIPLSVINSILDVPVTFFNKISAGFQSKADALDAEANLILARAELEKARKETLSSERKVGATKKADSIGAATAAPQVFESGLTCIKLKNTQ